MKVGAFRALQKESPLERELAAQLDRAGIAYERQFRFDPARKWKSDFYLRHYNILIEADGSVWSLGKTGRINGWQLPRPRRMSSALQHTGRLSME